MNIKVCGLNDISNIKEVVQLQPDLIGLIFYKKSLRNCTVSDEEIKALDFGEIIKVGVFVNESMDNLLQIAKNYALDYVQLHGNEAPEYCQLVKERGNKVIKAFSVDDLFDMELTNQYQFCDYLLFDTKGDLPGGNGKQFNWSILENYRGSVPFILSGGIGLQHADSVIELAKQNPLLSVLDINSQFEVEPGVKKIYEVKEFINKIKTSKYV